MEVELLEGVQNLSAVRISRCRRYDHHYDDDMMMITIRIMNMMMMDRYDNDQEYDFDDKGSNL